MPVGSKESNSWKDKTIQKEITLGCDNAINTFDSLFAKDLY